MWTTLFSWLREIPIYHLRVIPRLPHHCSVFQTEVTALKIAVDVLLRSAASISELNLSYLWLLIFVIVFRKVWSNNRTNKNSPPYISFSLIYYHLTKLMRNHSLKNMWFILVFWLNMFFHWKVRALLNWRYRIFT